MIDGIILLGVDNKVGIVEIIIVMEILFVDFLIFYGDILIVFMLDEEIGCGVNYFDVVKFVVQWVYIIDGGLIGELEYENFNVVIVMVVCYGVNVYLGIVKDKMVNVMYIVVQFILMMLENEMFQYIEGY